MNQLNLKKSTHLLSVVCTIIAAITMIANIGAIPLLSGTLLSQIISPEYLVTQIQADMGLSFSEWIILLICFIIKCSCMFCMIRYSKKLFSCISKAESPFTSNTTKCIEKISIFAFLSVICPIYPYYHLSVLLFIEGILVALVLRSIALIFHYGCELQQEFYGRPSLD